MANQNVDQGNIRPKEHNPNRDAKSGVAGPMLKITHNLKNNPKAKGGIKVNRRG